MDTSHSSSPGWSAYTRTAFIGFALIAAGVLAYEHWLHLLGALPWLVILACPLLHLFMHRGHGQHGGHDHSGSSTEPTSPDPTKERSNA
jgi:hypothetical protein